LWLVFGLSHFAGCSGGDFSAASDADAGNNALGGGVAQAGHGGSSAVAGTHANGGTDVSSSGRAGESSEPLAGAPSSAGEGGEAGAPPTTSECPCNAPTPTCQNGKCVVRGPKMVKAGAFYIDSSEVTARDYATFVKAAGDIGVADQAPVCAWNLSFERGPNAVPTGEATTDPVTGVDFCDATAYCEWAGKRLCGKVGGGSLALAELSDPTKSQWFAACGGPSGQLYPYGAAHKDAACNDASSGTGKVAPVASFEKCAGYYPGVFDMLGNAAEWVDACDGKLGPTDGCETIGGNFAATPTCSTSGLKHRNEQPPGVGFRCCSR
jgi:formylglycine-generating enzyme